MQTSFCSPFFSRTVVICSSESRVAFYFQTSRSRRPQTGWCSKAHFHYNRLYCGQVYAADWRLALREYSSITSHFIITVKRHKEMNALYISFAESFYFLTIFCNSSVVF